MLQSLKEISEQTRQLAMPQSLEEASVQPQQQITCDLWCCPRCRGALEVRHDELDCLTCAGSYPVFDGIPDLRIPGDCWIDYQDDRRLARRFIEEARQLSLTEQLRWVFAAHGDLTNAQIELRVRRVLASMVHLEEQIEGWLSECFASGKVTLDLGCGPGQLIGAANALGHKVVGIDVRLLWLLVAKTLITQQGGVPILAAALAERMPLSDGSVSAIVSLDVIEHVGDARTYLQEIDRIATNDCIAAFATPNRFSLAPEPHVGVWGVGFLPRFLQKPYVRWRTGVRYSYTKLLSAGEIRSLFRRHTRFSPILRTPVLPNYEVEHFSESKKRLAHFYNAAARISWLREPLLLFGPLFHVVATRNNQIERSIMAAPRSLGPRNHLQSISAKMPDGVDNATAEATLQ